MAKVIVLVGMAGVGKSTIGEALACLMGVEFADTDKAVEQASGLSLVELFDKVGESGFRQIESAMLEVFKSIENDCVLAVGGGIILSEKNREVLKNKKFLVVFLEDDIEAIYKRLHTKQRPLFTDISLDKFKQVYAERLPLYADVANGVLDIRGMSVERAVKQLNSLIPILYLAHTKCKV
ncbi:MAG: shikimate kinase [Firmicutes bacterium]|nr:shikimate kinase [Bacillota bacterium]